ncbi:MAG TPA: hypothetical protein VNY05_17310 [Candidatus Acidoferrales bacterium]|nr:hypothetical protein [Candidatus Acidoferrales bacterium]
MREAFNLYKERAESVQTLVTTLIGLSSLYALALGFTTFLSAQQYLQKLENNTSSSTTAMEKMDAQVRFMELRTRRQLRDIRVEAARQRRELQIQFPLFGGIDGMLSSILNELGFLSDSLMVDFDTFDDAKWRQKRQKVMFYERAIAGYNLLNTPVYERRIVEVFSGLGRFYRKTFQKTNQRDDLDRARFYSDIAVEKSGRRYMMLNNLAGIWLEKRIAEKAEVEKELRTEELRNARELADESLRKRPNQQCALYILAWIDDEEEDLPEAVRRLSEALKIPVWEDRPEPMLNAVIQYNLGCALSRFAAKQEHHRETNLDEAVKNLKLAIAAEKRLRPQFENDLTGDLKFLDSTKPQSIAEIRNVF